MVAEEFKKLMAAKGATVNIHHIQDVQMDDQANLLPFSSPGRIGKPIGSMRRFLRKVQLTFWDQVHN